MMSESSAGAIRPPAAPLVIGVGGCSGSGKTSIAKELARLLAGTHFPLDHYYRDLSHLPPDERSQQDFDDPEMLESDLLAEHVGQLAKGRAIDRPLYDFSTHGRVPGKTEKIEPGEALVVDGIFALHYHGLLPLYDLAVYVDTPDDICFARRLARDVRERGRTPESVKAQYDATVRPMAEKYVTPSARNAGLVLDGTNSPERLLDQVLAELRRRDLLTQPRTLRN
jgi:uridine kinase